ncbi:MAG: hypothetical protein ACJ707_08210 [Nitrososphaera sp.]
MEYKRTSAIVVVGGGKAGEVGGFIINQFKKRDIYTQDTGEKRKA